ncbi:MAG: 4-alpha-glucanotransferase [Prevotella sp.]|nr:4-alpha-glucanotransferase [Prevotella sp.]
MKLLFNLDYQTTFGEQLVLNIFGEDGRTASHAMSTNNGQQWTYEMTKADNDDTQTLCYYYSVQRGDDIVRTEWLTAPHQARLLPDVKSYVFYDRWIDIPEDSYLYSSAFTQCVEKRLVTDPQQPNIPTPHIVLTVRAAQLRSTDRLGVVGSPTYLGAWDVAKALPMTEQQPNEWAICLEADRLPADMEFKFVVLTGGDALWEQADNRTIVVPQLKRGECVAYQLAPAFFAIPGWRGAGTVVPVFSLRSEGSFGVGDFGDLKMMVDWCAKTGQRILQILPINDTTITHTWTDSYPYNAISIYALHPQFTDLRQLPPLKDEEQRSQFEQLRQELNALPQIDYERVNDAKCEYLKLIFKQEGARIMRTKAYKSFFEDNKEWLVPYADYCVKRDGAGDQAFWFFVQFNLDQQMHLAHEYARNNKVILKGDIPIGISRDGVEAQVEPRYFNLNGQAGAPPDAFSTNGQNWGFPTYNWDVMLQDGCSWWVRRFRKMAQFFDAYRIDHVLGFFRIWEIPIDAVHGLLGQFSPALGMSREEIEAYGLPFNEEHMTRPFIANWTLQRIFGERTAYVKEHFLQPLHDDIWQMKPEFDTQRKIEAYFADKDDNNLRDGLYALISDVLFVHDRKDPNKFHPRIAVQTDFVYEALWDKDKDAFNRLYNDYFYRRNNQYWYHEAMKKLPRLTQATRMLVCAEDLGMVPDCVAWVMNELRILSLEIQSMPKDPRSRFGYLPANPYRSVATISTHDMSTLRQWWDEDWDQTQAYYADMLHHGGPAPHPLPGVLAEEIVAAHLHSPSMLCLLSLQDWLSIDEGLRLADPNGERINIPANPRHYWRWRMHLTIEQLMEAVDFNREVTRLVQQSGR